MLKRISVKAQNSIVVAVAILVLAIGVSVVLIFSPRNVTSGPVGENATEAQYNPQPVGGLLLPLVPLEGDWYNKQDGLAFAAKVEGPTIKIEMLTDDGVGTVYWHGTFKTAESPNATLLSTKTEADDEIVLSQDATKDFQIGTDGITFKFSMMGFSRQVTLKR